MLDSTKQIAAPKDRKPVVSYAKNASLTGKFALPLAAVGLGLAVVTKKSKVMYALIGTTLGLAIEAIVNTAKRP